MIFPGGKGINVSIILKNFGVDNCALGFVAGYNAATFDPDKKDKYSYALKLGVSAGTASAFSEWMASKADIMNLMEKVEVVQD